MLAEALVLAEREKEAKRRRLIQEANELVRQADELARQREQGES